MTAPSSSQDFDLETAAAEKDGPQVATAAGAIEQGLVAGTDDAASSGDVELEADEDLDLDEEELLLMQQFGAPAPMASVPDDFRSGFVALVGRPNAGKSTLLNACLGAHAAITSPVAQTTRRRMRAVVNRPGAQVVIVDTPGLHKPKDALGEELNKSALGELADVDVVAMLLDATKPAGTGDAWVASHVNASSAVRLLVITKADLATPEQVQTQIEAAQAMATFDDVLVTSAQEGFNTEAFIQLVIEHLPYGPRWFPEDMPVDATDSEQVSEFVREKVLLNCRQEVPHAVGVLCDSIQWRDEGHASIKATIFVERDSQKGILVGKGGSMIKRIGTQARKQIEQWLGAQVFLDLEVRVKPSWRKDEEAIRRFGYNAEA